MSVFMCQSNKPSPSKSTISNLFNAETWIFDLDNTLYSVKTNLFSQIDWKMTQFVSEYLKLELEEARLLQKQYFKQFGTTMRGMMKLHNVNPKVFLNYVHDIDLTPILRQPQLNTALENLPGRKVIFTNASEPHARRIICRLGIEAHFQAIFDIVDSEYLPKPAPQAYKKLCHDLIIDPTRAVMVDDMVGNLEPAYNMGMKTVLIDTGTEWSSNDNSSTHINYSVKNLARWLSKLTPENAKKRT